MSPDGGVPSLLAPAPSSAVPVSPRPLGLTISGGVSLGTYEAGFVYLYLEAQKAKPRQQLKIVTGASAGSANSLIAAISSCQPPNPWPFDDLGWLVWGDIGFRDLFDRKHATGASLFTKDALDRSFERVRTTWKQGLPESCDVAVGIVVTRLTPRQVELQKGLSVPRLEEKFVVRIQGRGPGKPPKLSNYVIPASHLPQPLLPFVDDENDPVAADRNFGQLRSVIFASAAFPVAFAPQAVEYCLSKPPREGEVATEKNIECRQPEFLDLFVDGGVFDNNPLRLAYLVAENRLVLTADGQTLWRDVVHERNQGVPHPNIAHIYLDPDTTAFPPEAETPAESRDEGVVAQFFRLGGGFVETARSKELYALAQERKDLAERMRLTVSQYPKASEHLSAFVGFFERDFRVFDFYLGMYDAFRELKNAGLWSDEAIAVITSGDDRARREWAPFACMLSVYEPDYERFADACQGENLQNFRVLLQVSLDRLGQACKPREGTQLYSISGYHHQCTRERQGYPMPHVAQVEVLSEEQRSRRPKESAFEFFMRLLSAYGFEFTDLGLSSDEARLGKLAIRREFDDITGAWADAQPNLSDRLLAKTAGRTFLNNIIFAPLRVSGYLVLGTAVEAGFSKVPFGWQSDWLQFTGALGMNYFFTMFTPGESRVTFNLSAGPEFHLTFLSNAVVQPRIALRGGFQLGTKDRFGTQRCDLETTDLRTCTQALVEGVVVVSILERVRGQLVFQTYPAYFGKDARTFNLQFGIGFQFY